MVQVTYFICLSQLQVQGTDTDRRKNQQSDQLVASSISCLFKV